MIEGHTFLIGCGGGEAARQPKGGKVRKIVFPAQKKEPFYREVKWADLQKGGETGLSQGKETCHI